LIAKKDLLEKRLWQLSGGFAAEMHRQKSALPKDPESGIAIANVDGVGEATTLVGRLEDFRIEHLSWSIGSSRLLVSLSLSPGEVFCLWTVGALFVSAFGSADAHSKRYEFFVKFLQVLKLIDKIVRCF
jgi:hypothetical protein